MTQNFHFTTKAHNMLPIIHNLHWPQGIITNNKLRVIECIRTWCHKRVQNFVSKFKRLVRRQCILFYGYYIMFMTSKQIKQYICRQKFSCVDLSIKMQSLCYAQPRERNLDVRRPRTNLFPPGRQPSSDYSRELILSCIKVIAHLN